MRFVGLLSGGIDSPVAMHLMMNKGHEGYLLNMDARPMSDEAEFEKVKRTARQLMSIHGDRMKLFSAPHNVFLEAFRERTNRKYTCLLCKRAMINLADILCTRWDAQMIVLGDSMGQVASQTLPNLGAVSKGVKPPIMRPLIGLDKVEIERIGREIGTYQISSKSTVGCTAAPKYPIVRANPETLEKCAGEAMLDRLMEHVSGNVTEVDLQG